MKKLKPKQLLYLVSILAVSAFCSFIVPGEQKEKTLVYSQSVTNDYEDVLKELEEIQKQFDQSMTEEEKLLWTPVAALWAGLVAAVEFTVVAARVTVALSRLATPALQALGRAVQTAGGTFQLLTTLINWANIANLDNIKLSKEIEVYNLYKLG
jgi:hypothetical protein